MERVSRYKSLFESLEKLNSQKGNPKTQQEDLQQYRYLSSKLLQCINTQDKLTKDQILKCGGYVDSILAALEKSSDKTVTLNFILIVSDLLGKSQIGKRANTLISHGLTQILFHVLVEEYREQNPSAELLIAIHQVLGRIGPKDKKFCLKARLGQALSITLSLIRNYITGYKVLQPLLLVLKLYAANAVNASYLGKNGAVTYLFKILGVCGRKHLILLKYTLDTLSMLVKSKSNSARAVGQGGVPILLNMFFDWHRSDTKNRHIALRKAVLVALKNMTNLKSGRRTLIEADGIRVLYNTCMESIESRELESVIFTASLIMRRCFPRNRLPIQNFKSTLCEPLPESGFHKLELCPEGPLRRQSCANEAEDGNGDDSSLDDDDDISSEEERKDPKPPEEELQNSEFYARSAHDLQMYEKFFPELLELEEDSADDDYDDDDDDDLPIVIPTASATQTATQDRIRLPLGSQSTTELELARLRSKRHSYPSLPIYYNKEGSSDDSLRFRPCSAKNSRESANLSESAFAGLKNSLVITSYSSKSIKNGNRASSAKLSSNGSSRQKRKVSKLNKTSSKTRRNKKSDDSTSEESEKLDNFEDIFINDDHDVYSNIVECPEMFASIASRTNSVGRFSKLAYPDLHGSKPPPYAEPLVERKYGIQRIKIFEDIDRMINPEQIIDRVVFDLDTVVKSAGDMYTSNFSNHTNFDAQRVGQKDDRNYSESLKFNSQFECGNLRKVIQVRCHEYDFILSPDINTNHHHQWFYFEVSNMVAGVKYRFNIVNCEKPNSQFNFGMQPVMYSVSEAMAGKPYWRRVGSEICYYKNHFIRSSQTTGGVSGKTYYTTSFTIKFKQDRDVCYLAYHYPYTYSMLQAQIDQWERTHDNKTIFFRHQKLTNTISNNPLPLLTITSHLQSNSKEALEQYRNRPYIFLSSRVHPGESNSSWVMKGTIQYLLSDKPNAQALRDIYVFKIIPMLNPDGVINGNHRTSLTAEDLNRRWLQPCPVLHPTIYHSKGLLQYMNIIGRTPHVYCDYHGHSRKKNVFVYGCSPFQSWLQDDTDNPTYLGPKLEDPSYKILPKMLNQVAPAFALTNCSYIIEKSKEATARVVIWRQIRILRSYTMESTYAGCDIGPYRGSHVSTKELEEMGRKFGDGLYKMTMKSRPTQNGSNNVPLLVTIPPDIAKELNDETSNGGEAAGAGNEDLDSVTEESDADDDDVDDDDEEEEEDDIDEDEDDDDNAF